MCMCTAPYLAQVHANGHSGRGHDSGQGANETDMDQMLARVSHAQPATMPPQS